MSQNVGRSGLAEVAGSVTRMRVVGSSPASQTTRRSTNGWHFSSGVRQDAGRVRRAAQRLRNDSSYKAQRENGFEQSKE